MKLVKIIAPIFLVLLLALFFINKTPNKPIDFDTENNILIFTTPTCPHCQKVKDYINQNNLSGKLSIRILDLSKNKAYSQLITDKAKSCNLDTANIGVPLYYYQGKCLQGDQPIIDTLSQMIK